ncbi:MAG: EamA family transporter [Eubacteriales bacterium]|nr:EamA family transporter [Eubacteriales bacterium]
MEKNKSYGILPFIAYFNICFFWGTSAVANKIGATALGALTMGAVRFLTASFFVIIWLIIRKASLKMSKHDFIVLTFSGFMMYFLNTLLILVVSRMVDSSISTVVLCIVSVYIILIDSIWQRKMQVGLIGIIGIVLCFIGVAITVIFELFSDTGSSVFGIILLIFTPICWGIGSVVLKNSEVKASSEQQLFIQSVVPAILFTLITLITGEYKSADFTASGILAGMYMGVADSIIGLGSFIFLLKIWRTSVVSTYAFVNPIVGIFMSRLILGEAITANKIIGMLVILFGVYLIQNEKNIFKKLSALYVRKQVKEQMKK